MKDLKDVLLSSDPVVTEDLDTKLDQLINEARACLPKRSIVARDSLAQRVQDLKYLSKLSPRQRSLLEH
jgi:hypothetical protein